MIILTNTPQAQDAISSLIQTALYCLNLKSDKDEKDLKTFLNAFFSMQGPGFFEQLLDDNHQKAYAGAMCDLWHLFNNKPITNENKIQVSFFEHPYKNKQTFLSIISKDCSYVLKTIEHILKKNNIKYKNMMHPFVQVERNDEGFFSNILDTLTKKSHSYFDESIIHCLIVTPLTTDEKAALEQSIISVYKELHAIEKNRSSILEKFDFLKSSINLGQEEKTFLEWLSTSKYYCYGYRYFYFDEDIVVNEKSSLGLFNLKEFNDHKELKPNFNFKSDTKGIQIIKSSLRSNLNRGSRYDCIEIPDFDHHQNLIGLHQFIGVFTAHFFSSHPLLAPLARIKAQEIFQSFNFQEHWYSGKLLTMIMNSISLDLFFQLESSEIGAICQNVLEMQNDIVVYIKPSIKHDHSLVLTFMPMHKYSFELKEKIKSYFEEHLCGFIYSEHVLVGEYPFARVVFVVDHCEDKKVNIDIVKIQKEISLMSETWEECLEKLTDNDHAVPICSIFPVLYKEDFNPASSLFDFDDFKKITPENGFICNIHERDNNLNLHIFNRNGIIILSQFLPLLEKFGFEVFAETTYPLKHKDHPSAVLQVFQIKVKNNISVVLSDFKERFLQAIEQVWFNRAKNDDLNALIVLEDLDYRDLMLIRTFIRALRQMGIQYSYEYIIEILIQHHRFSKKTIQLFNYKFNVYAHDLNKYDALVSELESYCNDLKKRDEDRILRHFLNLIESSLRTNFYQTDKNGQFKDYISIKFNSQNIIGLISPRPLYEVFVYSMEMEGIHLRSGKVARGGIRWSDRLEDFRFEILGLMKAQIVKNSVIVPFGSKGGFIVTSYEQAKNAGADQETLKSMVINAYETLICGLLDITDNIVNDEIVKPRNSICHDDDDHYLVVAADKGTATFSDVANKISRQYNFWLDDAFASGGSKGYDHKKMGITARGAWVCVQRHFFEQGVDIQKESITVVGVGDMSGDVFGNGMLLSEKIKLIGAFNHEHIFIDPNPDPEKSFKERKRLFEMPGSKWSNYNKDLLSNGAGIYSRQDKWISLSNEAWEKLDFTGENKPVHPEIIIQHFLKAEVDLLFFGGIGTLVKSSNETHAQAKDKANDLIRVDAKNVRAKVIGEGANLGITQLGRIEYALNKGRINTDAVDNSAGVDCSDHEVNLKILFNILLQNKKITLEERDILLERMTNNVAELVLQDNEQQSFLLSVLEGSSKHYEKEYQYLMNGMANNSFLPLNIDVENLPDAQEVSLRQTQGQSFTRPELAVLIAYGKLHLYQNLLDNLDIEPYLHYLDNYFPQIMVEKFEQEIAFHPLKKQIICNYISNYIINRCGIKFIPDITNAFGISDTKVVEAFLKIVTLTEFDAIWNEITSDKTLTAQEKYVLWQKIIRILRQMMFCYLRNYSTFTKNPNANILDQFKTIVNTDLDPDKKQTDQLSNYPIILEMLSQVLQDKNLSAEKFLSTYKDALEILDFDFILNLTQNIEIHYEWERSMQFLVTDDLLKVIVECILKMNTLSSFDEWKNENVQNIELYFKHKDMAKVSFQQANNKIGLMTYMVKQISLLCRG